MKFECYNHFFGSKRSTCERESKEMKRKNNNNTNDDDDVIHRSRTFRATIDMNSKNLQVQNGAY